MKRFIVQADDDLIRRMKKRAAQRGVSVAHVVREALEDALGRGHPLPSFIGKYRSHGVGPPAAEIDDKYVAEPYKSDVPDKR